MGLRQKGNLIKYIHTRLVFYNPNIHTRKTKSITGVHFTLEHYIIIDSYFFMSVMYVDNYSFWLYKLLIH